MLSVWPGGSLVSSGGGHVPAAAAAATAFAKRVAVGGQGSSKSCVGRLAAWECVGHLARGEPDGVVGLHGDAPVPEGDRAVLQKKLEEAGSLVELADLVQCARNVRVVAIPDYRSLVGVGRHERVGSVGSG